ncbi:MAG TPA: PepSY-associated TM helix domain-containing protein, partial [Candidatus Limnocylindria bacterium]|nr:PepSY-associated TM helix domain-containing protein [Candidatus Limnocylindria bacterium]
MPLRKIIFWLHLIAGVVAGLVILVMSATGVALAFEKEVVAWAERDVRRVTPPSDVKRLPLDELLAKVRAAQPEARPSGVTIYSDPTIATLVSIGRTNGFHVNPYTADVQPQGAKGTRAFMHQMIDWHRFLGAHDAKRPIGKAITGACNAAFCFLALSGLYLWWPRQWTKTAFRSITLFNWKLSGKPRDWNWHNVIGLWSAPVLIVLTLTAMPISYRWASDVIYKLTRSEPPAQAGPPGAAPSVEVPTPPSGTKTLSQEALLASVQKEIPQWSQITLRLGGGGGPRGGGGRLREGATNTPPSEARGVEARAPQAVTFAVKQSAGAPRFATSQITLNPFTGEVLRAEKYSDYNLGRRVRSWTRFLHTGEALG